MKPGLVSNTLRVTTDHDGWTALVPAGAQSVNPLTLLMGLWILAMGLAFAAPGLWGAGFFARQLLRGGSLFFVLPMLFGLVFMAGGLAFGSAPLYHIVQSLRCTRLEVSGRHLSLRPYVLGLPVGRTRRIHLEELGPVSLERPRLTLAPGLTIVADIADHGDVTLVGLLRQSIAQAQAQPDHLPPTPAALEALRSPES